MISIKNFDSNLLKIGKRLYKDIGIYYIGYTKKKYFDHVKTTSLSPLYLIIDKVDGYIEEINGNK